MMNEEFEYRIDFKKFYINGNRYTLIIEYKSKKIRFSFEKRWNKLMIFLTKLKINKKIKKNE